MRMLSLLLLLLAPPVFAQRLIKEPVKETPLVVETIVDHTPADSVVVIERGTGFVLAEPRGLIVTANHVVKGVNPEVRLRSGKVLKTSIAHADESLDLLVLRVDQKDFALLPKGLRFAGAMPKAGQHITTIGHPSFPKSRYEWSTASGIVAATGRSIKMPTGATIANMIQLDAAINNGNSGGPLLNERGEVVGLVTAYHAEARGIGFALSGKAVQEVVRGTR